MVPFGWLPLENKYGKSNHDAGECSTMELARTGLDEISQQPEAPLTSPIGRLWGWHPGAAPSAGPACRHHHPGVLPARRGPCSDRGALRVVVGNRRSIATAPSSTTGRICFR